MTTNYEDVEVLYRRVLEAGSPAARAAAMNAVEAALAGSHDLTAKAELLLCRAKVRIHALHFGEALQDATAAIEVFDSLAAHERALDATSLAVACAAQVGELALSADLASRCVRELGSLTDRKVAALVAFRLGNFYGLAFDWAAAVEHYEEALSFGSEEGGGTSELPLAALYNAASVLLLAMMSRRYFGEGEACSSSGNSEVLSHVRSFIERLERETAPGSVEYDRAGWLRAAYLSEGGRPEAGLAVIEGLEGGARAMSDYHRSPAFLVKAQCLRALGRADEAITAAETAVRLHDDEDPPVGYFLALRELIDAKRSIRDFQGASDDAVLLANRLWAARRRHGAQVLRDVQVRAELEGENVALSEAVTTDTRTNLANTAAFDADHGQLHAAFQRSGEPYSLLIVDIDRFHDYNTRYGYLEGNNALRAVAEAIRGELRQGDRAYRWGGEEFAVLLPMTSLSGAIPVAERIRSAVQGLGIDHLDNVPCVVTVTIGVVDASRGNGSPDEVFKRANVLLLDGKGSGKNRLVAG